MGIQQKIDNVVMNSQHKADAKAAAPVLPQLFETEKEVILGVMGTMHGLALPSEVPTEMIERLESLRLVIPASNIGGFKRPAVLTQLGGKVFRHLRHLEKAGA